MSRTEHKPDTVSKVKLYGTTYEIREYFDEKRTLEEIISKRILYDLSKDESPPNILDPEMA